MKKFLCISFFVSLSANSQVQINVENVVLTCNYAASALNDDKTLVDGKGEPSRASLNGKVGNYTDIYGKNHNLIFEKIENGKESKMVIYKSNIADNFIGIRFWEKIQTQVFHYVFNTSKGK